MRKQVDVDKNGRLIYNGKPYTKDTWCCYNIGGCDLYGPPKVIRQQGRVAREVPNPVNNNPEISILTEKGDILRLDACPCGGELLMDHREVLYCSDCHLIYE